MKGPVGSSLAALSGSLPWCCIAPAALASAGLTATGLGLLVQRLTPWLLAASVLLVGRSLHLALVRRRGRPWARALAVAAAPAVVALWTARLL